LCIGFSSPYNTIHLQRDLPKICFQIAPAKSQTIKKIKT